MNHSNEIPPTLRSLMRFIPLLVILMISTSVHAYQPTLVFDPLEIICEKEGFHELGMSQTVDGVTVHLERAYADTEVIRLIIRIEGLTYEQYRKPLIHDAGTLEDEQGNSFDPGYLPDAIPCLFDRERAGTRPAEGMYLSVISANGFSAPDYSYMPFSGFYETYYGGTPETLSLSYDLTLQIPKATPTPMNPESTAEPQPEEFDSRAFHFDFSVPVQGDIILEPNQTVEANGFAVTLTKVRIGKSSTTVQLCYPEYIGVGLAGLMFMDQYPITLIIGEYEGWQGDSRLNESDSSETRWCVDYHYTMYFGQPPATLTLNIEKLHTQIDYGVEARDKWEQFVELAAEQGIEVELETVDGRIRSREQPTDKFTGEDFFEALRALYLQADLMEQLEGPWTFTVDIP